MSLFGHSTQVSSHDQLAVTWDYKKENFFTVVACSFLFNSYDITTAPNYSSAIKKNIPTGF